MSAVKGVYSPISFVQSDFKFASGSLMFMRRFSVEVPASEQMNLIKQLRERTSAPIKDVKSSLVNCNWDIGNFILILFTCLLRFCLLGLQFVLFLHVLSLSAEAAQKDLRKRGVVLASKKSSRTAAEGLLAVAQNEKKAVVIELNCETDFVARNEIFQCLVSRIFTKHLYPTVVVIFFQFYGYVVGFLCISSVSCISGDKNIGNWTCEKSV